MERLIDLHEQHQESHVRAEIEAAWLHHRFTQIHPFQDGNGRIARALATLVFIRGGFLPLVIRSDPDSKKQYLDALESADDGELAPLVNLFANIEARDLEEAITDVRDLRSGSSFREIATAAAGAAKRHAQEDEDALAKMTDQLVLISLHRMGEIAFELQEVFKEDALALDTMVGKNEETNEAWWYEQIIQAAQRYRYFADLGRFRRWVQLRLQIREGGRPRWNAVISFHHKEMRSGVMAAVAFLTSTGPEHGESRPVILGSLNEFSYSRGSKNVEEDFKAWLEKALTELLTRWQERI